MQWGAKSAAATNQPTLRVLVVNSNESDRAFLERMLRQKGYETSLAADGLEALRVADANGPFDLLITDVVLPGMDGGELARRLRIDDSGLKILYLTENSDRLFEERPSLWEDEAFLEKPVTVQGLFEAVGLLLEGHIPPPRAVRVRIPGAHVKLEHHVADLVSLSQTGALIQTGKALTEDATLRLAIELPSETIQVTGRVVRCDRKPESPAGVVSEAPFEVAIAFVNPSTRASRALQRWCTRPEESSE